MCNHKANYDPNSYNLNLLIRDDIRINNNNNNKTKFFIYLFMCLFVNPKANYKVDLGEKKCK
jgi:hypothetical protein